MSQSARNDPEGYRQREGEHKPYEPVKATKPEATDGDRELAAKICYLYGAAVYDGERWNGSIAAIHIADLIAAHVAARLAPLEARLAAVASDRDKWMEVAEVRGRILAAVEAERDALRATVVKLEEFQEINDSEFTAEVSARKQAESERDALKRLLTDSVCRIQETDGESLLVKRIMEAL